ncbi:hypothetical protein B0H11DRAFT_1033359 [Mycena galericulata]|nr:hypothetical protein B0H11DRAFT_1033359 [Mycena galericulata]
MKSTSSGAPSPTSTSFSGISNYRTESYRPLRAKNVPHVPSIDYRIVSETHFNEFDRYLAAYLAKAAPNSRSTARQKLTRLTIEQFSELSTDVYDELVRRENEKEVPFLPVREEFHPKRNQARQKLATLPVTRFEDLCSDVHWELIRRYPEFKEAPSELQQANEDTMGASEELQGEEGSKLLRRRPRLPLQHELSMAPLTFARGRRRPEQWPGITNWGRRPAHAEAV